MPTPNRRNAIATQAVTLLTIVAFLVCSSGAATGQAIPRASRGGGPIAAPPVDVLPQVERLGRGISSLEKLRGSNPLATFVSGGGDARAFNEVAGADKLVIHQGEPQAVIDWKSFNIGREAWTHFDQRGNTSWKALNRIYDRNPSLIFGRLTADGRVFLINQNGILFGPDSRVNVHSLTASTLDIRDEDFLGGRLRFRAENYQEPGEPAPAGAFVANEGFIDTGKGGSVFLIGREVENAGRIASPVGQVGLAAGDEVEIGPDTSFNSKRTALVVNVKRPAGEVSNRHSGRIETDSGLAGMYGRIVNQEGIVRAVTAVKKAGKIELHASERITTGAKSLTATPVSDSEEKVNESFPYRGGEITLGGLDPDHPLFPQVPVQRIEHRGTIEAPSGVVTLEAKERVFLENGSRIDVSGVWVDLPAAANQISVQLNSVNLRDDFGQKQGILKGKTVSVNALFGSAIGDISGYLVSQDKTALERSTAGGEVFLYARGGDIILKQEATVDFSGGGIRYSPGAIQTTQLLSGGRVYDISLAPQYLNYTPVGGALDYYHALFARHGLAAGIEGLANKLYFGLNTLSQSFGGFVEGADAGSLNLISRQMALDGRLDGSVTRGPFQNRTAELVSATGNQMTRGRKAPQAGSLILGNRPVVASPELRDMVLEKVVLRPEAVPLPATFGLMDVLPGGVEPDGTRLTTLSSRLINRWRLGGVQILANTSVVVEGGTQIALAPGGSFSLSGRRIEHRGAIEVPAGQIRLEILDNITSLPSIRGSENPRFVPVHSRIFLENASRLSTAGQRVNLTLEKGDPLVLTQGGEIVLSDRTSSGDGVIAKRGASVDVSGGWKIDSRGKLSGGDGGTFSAAGPTLALDAELRGHAIEGRSGGRIRLHATAVSLRPKAPSLPHDFRSDSSLPADLEGGLVFEGGRFENAGFGSWDLTAVDDLRVETGVALRPSPWKISASPGGATIAAASSSQNRLRQVSSDQVGASALTFKAGEPLPGENLDGSPREKNFHSSILLESGTSVRSAPGGKVTFEAPQIKISGEILASAGEISLRSRQGDVRIASGAVLSAAAANVPRLTPVLAGFPAGFDILDAGRITIDSNRDLVLDAGARIDVSGSTPIVNFMPPTMGGAGAVSAASAAVSPVPVTEAGAPGRVSLSFLGQLQLEGTIHAQSRLEGRPGGQLSLVDRGFSKPLALGREQMGRWLAAGFDVIELTSRGAIDLAAGLDAWVPRRLVLDAPEIRGAGGEVRLGSTWVRLANSHFPASGQPLPGEAKIEIHGGWIDLEGSVRLSGFGESWLSAAEDVRFFDRYYSLEGQSPRYEGNFAVPGALTIQAARIYPGTAAEFTVTAKGRLTTLPSGTGGGEGGNPPSAGGRLTFVAADIEHRGALFAPMGEIGLEAARTGGRLYLAAGSVLSTAGKTPAKYGELDETFWTKRSRKTLETLEVRGAPEKRIALKADEIILREGALFDASGGGGIFAYQFLPGIDGSRDPLKVAGRYVILPDGAFRLPGPTVYIAENTAGLRSGTFSLLPEEYAFLPGAVILQATGTRVLPGALPPTPEGFPVAAGCFTEAGFGASFPVFQGFAVRPAEAVLAEGFFRRAEFVAGEGGTLSFAGRSTILDGTIRASSLPGFSGGMLDLVGTQIRVIEQRAPLPVGFGFETPLAAELVGFLDVAASSISGQGFRHIGLGSGQTTASVTIDPGSLIDVLSLTVAAKNEIAIGRDATLMAVGAGENGGRLSLLSPAGRILIASGALLSADRELSFDTRELDFHGDFRLASGGGLIVAGDALLVVPDGYPRSRPGLHLEERLWSRFGGIAEVTLQSRSDLLLASDASLAAAERLTVDAARIAGLQDGGRGEVRLSAPAVLLRNSGAVTGGGMFPTAGVLRLTADTVALGRGEVQTAGFSLVRIDAAGEIGAVGRGGLTASGDLTLTASRLTAQPFTNGGETYEPADFRIEAPGRILALAAAPASGSGAAPPGMGKLALRAGTLDIGGTIAVESGEIRLEAEVGGVLLGPEARLLARGGELAPGGRVSLSAPAGPVAMRGGSVIDVSAGSQGDAGAIALSSPIGGVELGGTLVGLSAGGRGGSLALDTSRMDDFSAFNRRAADGGFSGELSLRARTGDLTVAPEQAVRAGIIRLAADGGAVRIFGSLDASGAGAGAIEVFAASDVVLAGGSRIAAAAGGRVALHAAIGEISLAEAARIDVSGSGAGGRGEVALRALRQADDVRIRLEGTIAGAEAVFAEAFRIYNASSITSALATAWRGDAQTFMNSAPVNEARLLSRLTREGWDAEGFHLLPGIEVRSAGDMTLSSGWDLTSWRFAGEPGVLTLRAAGNLILNANLVDHPTPLAGLPGTRGRDSWMFRLAAGSDFGAADPLAVMPGAGDLRLADGRLIYTESAPIHFAAGRDMILGPGAAPGYMIRSGIRYSVGSFDGNVQGIVGRDLHIRGGAIQTSAGDIAIQTGRHLSLQVARDFGLSDSYTSLGSIRTTGMPGGLPNAYWNYVGGGDIRLHVGGNLQSGEAKNAWDWAYGTRAPRTWAPSFENDNATEGLATMGGGSLRIEAGGDVFAQAGAFGQGDLKILAGGNLLGRFLVRKGEGKLVALASAGSDAQPLVFELFDARMSAAAMGDLRFGAAVNPTIAREQFTGTFWELGYSPQASVSLSSQMGDVRLMMDSPYYVLGSSQVRLERIMPPSLSVRAGRDIIIKNEMALAPAANSNLVLSADRDINGLYSTPRGTGGIEFQRALVAMSDMDPAAVYGVVRNPPVAELFSPFAHAATPLHSDDSAPIRIQAGRDIIDLRFFLPKASMISAGRDVKDILYKGQNILPVDITAIAAGRDLFFSTGLGGNLPTGIEHGGPGLLYVSAGNRIDLGLTRGISTVGNAYHPALGNKGSDLVVSAGYRLPGDEIPAGIERFFKELQAGGDNYSRLLNSGDSPGAALEIERIRKDIIAPLLSDAKSGLGLIDMTSSQISTSSAADNLYLLAAGSLRVGRSTFLSEEQRQILISRGMPESTGIYTASGGSISIFTEGDIDVNESRIMTFRGGDILLWSDRGNINAGRGSKTAINVNPPRVEAKEGQYVLVFRPPAVGSGIRALTYDPDGVEGPLEAPPFGDIFAFAPQGVIDAGEAGIAGGRVILGATAVLNAQNISFVFGSVGVPDPAGAAAGIGALAGAGGVSETSKIAQESAALKSAEERMAKFTEELNKHLVPRIILVEVLGFEEEKRE